MTERLFSPGSRRVAVFGLGSMGRRYLELLADATTYGLVTDDIFIGELPCKVNKGKKKQNWFQWVESPTQLKERLQGWPLDLAVIATPANTHVTLLAEIAELFPSAAILVEKPLTDGRLDDLSGWLKPELFARDISVGYNWRFHPSVRQLKRRQRQIVSLSLYVAEDMSNWPGVRYGMPLYEFSHEFDLVRHLSFNPFVLTATATNDRYCVRGEHDNGEWKVVVRPANTPKGRWVRVEFSDGWRWSCSWPTDKETIEKTYEDQLSNIAGSCGPRTLVCPLWEGVATAKFVDTIAAAL